MKNYLLIIFFVVLAFKAEAQVGGPFSKNDTIKMQIIVIDGDTLPFKWLPEVAITEKRLFKNARAAARYDKLYKNVKKVLPYAALAGQKFRELEAKLAMEKNEARQKELTKATEVEIRKNFEEELKKLTISQGRILIKLIDRETQHTSYEILQDWRGGFSAVLWQGVARVFGTNLKSQYDATDTDKEIESVIMTIEEEQRAALGK